MFLRFLSLWVDNVSRETMNKETTHHNAVLRVKDYLVSGKYFDLIKPYAFDYLQTHPVPDSEELQKYYQSEDYVSHNDKASGFIHRVYRFVKKWNLKLKYAKVKNHLDGADQLLDIGAGTGDFVEICKQYNKMAFGVEPNETARKQAQSKAIQLKADYKTFVQGQFKVITLWHVLEHMPDVDAAILQQKELLCDDGVVVLALPNYKSFDAKLFQSFWAAYDVPRHIHHFSAEAIRHFYERHQFKLISFSSMWFDAFYISILSSKYKKWPLPFFVGIFLGIVSNLLAIFTQQSSSRIYIFRKLK